MISIGKPAPAFRLPGIVLDKERNFSLDDVRGRWLILFFYPADFTFICPTEITGFQKRYEDFKQRDANIFGVSVDPVETHRQWAKELGGLSYPLLSDATKEVARTYGVLDEVEGVASRSSFIISPTGLVLYAVATSMNVGRSVQETYRVLAALQSGRLCPADWQPGEETGDVSLKY